jgi:hypothetical protein
MDEAKFSSALVIRRGIDLRVTIRAMMEYFKPLMT